MYCLEETDNGKYLNALSVNPRQEIRVEQMEDSFGKTCALIVKGRRECIPEEDAKESALYSEWEENTVPVDIKAVPYYLWGNRGKGEMLVWIRLNSIDLQTLE